MDVPDELRAIALAEFTWVRWRRACPFKPPASVMTKWHARARFDRFPNRPLTACKVREIEGSAEVASGVPAEGLCAVCVQRVLNRAYPTRKHHREFGRERRAAA